MATLEELMGLTPTQAAADRLRGRQQAADFFGMSTIEPLAQAAQREQQAIGEQREQQSVLQRALATQQAQADRERQAQAARAEEAALDRASRERMSAADIASRERLAGAKTGRPSATQKTAQYRADTFSQGLRDMEGLLGEGYDPTGLGGLKDKYASRSDMLRWAASPEGEQWQSASNTVKEAALRTATGAAAPQGENAEYIATLIPQPFEDAETVKFKMNKLREFEGILRELGGQTDEEAATNYNAAVERLRASDEIGPTDYGSMSDDEIEAMFNKRFGSD